MTRPSFPSSGSRLRFKASHRRFGLKTSHRRPGDGSAMERDEERERYIAPPRKFRR